MQTPYAWTPVIVAHAAMAVVALALGAFLLLRAKGTRSHRVGGWLWVTLMASVAAVSFTIFRDRYSWIHGLSVFTLVMLAVGVTHARRHRVRSHRITMLGLFFGALVIAGLFTLLPDRLIGSALWALIG